MLNPDGDKQYLRIVLTKTQYAYIEQQAKQCGLSFSSYIRTLIAHEIQRESSK